MRTQLCVWLILILFHIEARAKPNPEESSSEDEEVMEILKKEAIDEEDVKEKHRVKKVESVKEITGIDEMDKILEIIPIDKDIAEKMKLEVSSGLGTNEEVETSDGRDMDRNDLEAKIRRLYDLFGINDLDDIVKVIPIKTMKEIKEHGDSPATHWNQGGDIPGEPNNRRIIRRNEYIPPEMKYRRNIRRKDYIPPSTHRFSHSRTPAKISHLPRRQNLHLTGQRVGYPHGDRNQPVVSRNYRLNNVNLNKYPKRIDDINNYDEIGRIDTVYPAEREIFAAPKKIYKTNYEVYESPEDRDIPFYDESEHYDTLTDDEEEIFSLNRAIDDLDEDISRTLDEAEMEEQDLAREKKFTQILDQMIARQKEKLEAILQVRRDHIGKAASLSENIIKLKLLLQEDNALKISYQDKLAELAGVAASPVTRVNPGDEVVGLEEIEEMTPAIKIKNMHHVMSITDLTDEQADRLKQLQDDRN